MSDEPSSWMTSKPIAAFLKMRRDNDVKVKIGNMLVPISDLYYDSDADSYVIELVDGDDYKLAMGL